jgi:sRNA-binding protein
MAKMPFPEPKFLLDARTEAREAARRVDGLQQRVDQIAASISALSILTSWWRRAIDWVTGAGLHRQSKIAGLRATQKKAELAVKQAEEAQLRMDRSVAAAESKHREAARAHFEKWNQEAAYTEQRLAAIKAAEQFWQSMPGASYLGFDAVHAVGRRLAEFQNRETNQRTRSRGRGGIPTPRPH